jgi:hypothetical protein
MRISRINCASSAVVETAEAEHSGLRKKLPLLPLSCWSSKTQRMTFSPDEMAGAFDSLQRANQVQGMFLSSGIIHGSVTTQDKIIDTAEIMRNPSHFRGYLHLKIMPGIEYYQLYRLMQLSTDLRRTLLAARDLTCYL